jgi:hypothetical protein
MDLTERGARATAEIGAAVAATDPAAVERLA